ncbi:DUF1127 domain-containing protein [Anderseniella sp. Alg231-50]|uniref:DUF1127 domain-containing protein n=1 Tax=Anderseniella sp. Alg231-50 TaxID=1922226 RepID=UPI000D5576A2
MSMATLFRNRSRNESVSVTHGQKVFAILSGKGAEMALLADRFRRKANAGTGYLDTSHLNDHVLRDIGLERSDLTKPG